jgi:aryl-alcohol dehydrogenase-like predicted oxidoreductase
VVRRLGVSVYDATTLNAVLDAFPLELVQLPLNVLDQRFLHEGTIDRLARDGVEVHARSSFLQGVVLTEPQRLPERFAPVRPQIERFQADAAAHGLTPEAVALAFTAGCAGVSRVVLGVNSAGQLRGDAAGLAAAGPARAQFDFSRYAVADSALVDPRTWS